MQSAAQSQPHESSLPADAIAPCVARSPPPPLTADRRRRRRSTLCCRQPQLAMPLELGADGAQWNYVVSAQRPTSVQHSAVGHFTSTSELSLVVA